jgi:hypothetical protein
MKLKWSPRTLPAPPRAPGRKPPQIVTETVMGAVFLLWWTGVIQFRALVPIPPFVHVHLAHVWAGLFWPVLAYSSAEIVINGLELARPGWVRPNAGLSLLKDIFGCALLMYLLRAGHWIDVNAKVAPHALAQMRHGFDKGMQVGMTITLLVLVAKALAEAWRLVRAGGSDGGPARASAVA